MLCMAAAPRCCSHQLISWVNLNTFNRLSIILVSFSFSTLYFLNLIVSAPVAKTGMSVLIHMLLAYSFLGAGKCTVSPSSRSSKSCQGSMLGDQRKSFRTITSFSSTPNQLKVYVAGLTETIKDHSERRKNKRLSTICWSHMYYVSVIASYQFHFLCNYVKHELMFRYMLCHAQEPPMLVNAWYKVMAMLQTVLKIKFYAFSPCTLFQFFSAFCRQSGAKVLRLLWYMLYKFSTSCLPFVTLLSLFESNWLTITTF